MCRALQLSSSSVKSFSWWISTHTLQIKQWPVDQQLILFNQDIDLLAREDSPQSVLWSAEQLILFIEKSVLVDITHYLQSVL
jgi:hypothetical protein